MGNITSMQEKDKSGTTPRTTKHAQTNSDESIKSNLSKTNSSKANKKGEVSENTIISSFTAENSMKEKEYSKFMEKVKDFNPKILKKEILDYIDSRTSSTRGEFDHFYGEIARGCMKQTPDHKFTESLNYIAWHHYTIVRHSTIIGQTIPPQELIDNITLKVLSMKDFILEHLGKLFDLMITFEFTRTLKNILREYAVGLKESDLNDIITEKALDTQNLPKNLVDILSKFYGESTYYHITGGQLLNFEVEDIDIQSVNLILQKVNSRFEFIRTFVLNLLNFFLGYLGFDEKEVSSSKTKILRNINSLLLEKRSNLRGLSYYLVQVIHSKDLLPRASHLIEKIKNSKLDEQIDTGLLQHHLTKKVNQLPPEQRPPLEEDDFLVLSDQEYFSRDFQIIIPEFSDRDICSKFLEEFKSKDIYTLRRLLKAIKRFSKLMTMSHTKGLYYPIDLLNVLEEWMARNFGLIEIEFQINVLRMIVGNLEDVKVLIHLLMLEAFSKAEKENNFMQLFVNSLTVDIEIGKNASQL